MDSLLTTAIHAATDAGAFIMSQYGHSETTLKADMSPVTQADIGANTRILDILLHTGIPILSEESLDLSHISFPYPETLWIIDPLDGTRDFINGTGDFSVMIGLLSGGRPILSVVYAPATDTLFYAKKGQGAYMKQGETITQLHVSTRTTPDLHFIKSKYHYSDSMETIAQKLFVTKATPRGSVGIKAGILGTREGDFFFYLGPLGVWDICGPELIVEEAGGTVTDLHGDPIAYTDAKHRISQGIVFSNSTCHGDVLEAVRTTLFAE